MFCLEIDQEREHANQLKEIKLFFVIFFLVFW